MFSLYVLYALYLFINKSIVICIYLSINIPNIHIFISIYQLIYTNSVKTEKTRKKSSVSIYALIFIILKKTQS